MRSWIVAGIRRGSENDSEEANQKLQTDRQERRLSFALCVSTIVEGERIRKRIIVVAITCIMSQAVLAASVDKAAILRRHGLLAQAKSELIDMIFSSAADTTKAVAYYDLGSIAFEENSVSLALETWTTLVSKYPNSGGAKRAAKRGWESVCYECNHCTSDGRNALPTMRVGPSKSAYRRRLQTTASGVD